MVTLILNDPKILIALQQNKNKSMTFLTRNISQLKLKMSPGPAQVKKKGLEGLCG